MYHPTDRIAHTTVFVTPVVEHWLEPQVNGVGHMVKDQSDSERGNPLPPHALLFPISSNDYLNGNIGRLSQSLSCL